MAATGRETHCQPSITMIHRPIDWLPGSTEVRADDNSADLRRLSFRYSRKYSCDSAHFSLLRSAGPRIFLRLRFNGAISAKRSNSPLLRNPPQAFSRFLLVTVFPTIARTKNTRRAPRSNNTSIGEETLEFDAARFTASKGNSIGEFGAANRDSAVIPRAGSRANETCEQILRVK